MLENVVVKYYDGFVKVVEQLSMNAEEQIEKLRGTMVTDEIASDYTEIGMFYAKELLHNNWITYEQYYLAECVESKLEQMTQKKELWNNNALLYALEWEECRKKARELLHTLTKQM